ncbi:MAG: HAD-IA family hydrolase [Candidatus Diapherotrites archaeon]|nr:HAD-IA family hydrolase [Candidatus Diapherotrites archaeon]
MTAFIFDLDGTLIDTRVTIIRCFNHALREMSLPEAEEKDIMAVLAPLADMFTHFVPQDRVKEACALYRQRFQRHAAGESAIFPGVEETLRQLKGKKAVATTKEFFARELLLKLGLYQYFDAVITGADVKKQKPDPEIIGKALQALEAKPEDAVYVGDTGNDMEAAKQAGVRFVAASYGYGSALDLSGADFTINSFPDLLKLPLS